ncbi:hypothetical protein HID58_037737 [Brassica napus]|uniref:Uncharacterized protein n=1 Tax=Brassica napus TaxID=3708 RepID=A0ABQ8BM95_BRANA|nr:hypothetical protein HID58_037737 [Brassica napus]
MKHCLEIWKKLLGSTKD